MRFPSAIALATLLVASAAHATAADEEAPQELAGISIEERPGAVLPKDLVFHDQTGKAVKLGDYFDGQKPTLVVLAYYQCPMLCTLVLNGLSTGMSNLAWNAGEQYRVVTVSIDPRDTTELAAKKRDNYVHDYGRPVGEKGWDFLTSDEQTVKKLADTLGFKYRWDAATQQYAHAAGAFVVTPAGTLSRTLYGIVFPPETLRLSLLEASQGKLGSAWDKVLLLCFHYDPSTRGYVLAATRLMRAGGVFTLLALAVGLGLLFRREREASERPAERLSP